MVHAKTPVDMAKMPQEEIDKQILRSVMMAELDAISLYEQMCYNTSNKKIKDLLEELIDEEKEHFEQAEDLLETMEGDEDTDEDD